MEEENIGLEFIGFSSVFVSPEKQKGLHTYFQSWVKGAHEVQQTTKFTP